MCKWIRKEENVLFDPLNWTEASSKVLICISAKKRRLRSLVAVAQRKEAKYGISKQIKADDWQDMGFEWRHEQIETEQRVEKEQLRETVVSLKSGKWDPFLFRFLFHIFNYFLVFSFILNSSLCNLREKRYAMAASSHFL